MAKYATITIRVVGGGLQYTAVNADPSNNGKKHKVKSADRVRWECPDGAFTVVFNGGLCPFDSGEVALGASQGHATDPQTTAKPADTIHSFKYSVVVARPDLVPVVEDPELEVDGTPGPSVPRGRRSRSVKPKPPRKR